jgi:hypothetical protein
LCIEVRENALKKLEAAEKKAEARKVAAAAAPSSKKSDQKAKKAAAASSDGVVNPFTPAGDKKLLAPEMAKSYNPKSVGALTSGPTLSKFNPDFQSYFSRCSFDRPSSPVAIRFLNPGRKSFSLAGYIGQMAVNASVQHSVRSWG